MSPFHFRLNFSFIITSSYVLTITQSNILSLTDCIYNFEVQVSNNITKSKLTKTENRNPLFTMYLISPFPPSQIQSMSGNNNFLSQYICTQLEHNNSGGIEPHTCPSVCPKLRLALSSRDIHPVSANNQIYSINSVFQFVSCNLLSTSRNSFAILSISVCQSTTEIADFIFISVFLAR